MVKAVRGRFAPSPSGEMHLGNVWTALLAWLQVRSQGGTMILRVEDLDPERSRPEYTEQLMRDLQWLGLDWDEGPDVGGPYGPYCQNERRDIYHEALNRLTAKKLLYPCYCTRGEIQGAASAPHAGDGEMVYPGTCRGLVPEMRKMKENQGRRPALRLKVSDCYATFTDGLYGVISQDVVTACGDFIVRRSDGVHAYQLAVVVDDALMRVSHVLRGYDLLASTPRQLYLYHLLNFTPPEFTHVPLLISPDGHRLSKRQKDLALAALRAQGVTAEAVIGFLAWKAGLVDCWQPVKAHLLIDRFTLDALPRAPVVIETDILLC